MIRTALHTNSRDNKPSKTIVILYKQKFMLIFGYQPTYNAVLLSALPVLFSFLVVQTLTQIIMCRIIYKDKNMCYISILPLGIETIRY